jgi:hypothetical protein
MHHANEPSSTSDDLSYAKAYFVADPSPLRCVFFVGPRKHPVPLAKLPWLVAAGPQTFGQCTGIAMWPRLQQNIQSVTLLVSDSAEPS